MKAVIEFDYSDYAVIDDTAVFSLVIYNEAEEKVLDEEIGVLKIPKGIIEYIGEEDMKWNGVFDALCKAKTKLNYYWEE
jgi:hypothetical protein